MFRIHLDNYDPASSRVKRAITIARRVRRELVRCYGDRRLEGQCGLASTKIALELGDARALRLGSFIKQRRFWNHTFGPYPHDHAWCLVDGVIIDVTATQFGRFPAVYVINRNDTTRYRETMAGVEAAQTMTGWDYPQWAQVLRQLRAVDNAHS